MIVEQFYTQNQFLINDKGTTIFQSYKSKIATIKNGVLTLTKKWDYSKTTTKYLYYFLNDFLHQISTEQKKYIENLQNEKNKKQYILKLINEKIIKVKE